MNFFLILTKLYLENMNYKRQEKSIFILKYKNMISILKIFKINSFFC